MPIVTQDNRLFEFTSPLSGDFAVIDFSGREEISRPFRFLLTLISSATTVAADDIVGKEVSWVIKYPEETPRHFHGWVQRLSAGPFMSRTLRTYQLEVVPWLWFLSRSSDCKIFQNKTAPAI